MGGHVVADHWQEGDRIAAALVGILTRVHDREPVLVDTETCYRCGCLCLPDERCPGCAAVRAATQTRWPVTLAG